MGDIFCLVKKYLHLHKKQIKNISKIFCIKILTVQWLWVINVAVLYNLIVVVGRAVFWELDNLLPATWLLLDYACDFLYVVDTFIRMHEGVYSVDIYDWFQVME